MNIYITKSRRIEQNKWNGFLVTRCPGAFIIGTVMIPAATSTGFIVLQEEKDGLKLWQLKDSDFVKNTEGIRDTFLSSLF